MLPKKNKTKSLIQRDDMRNILLPKIDDSKEYFIPISGFYDDNTNIEDIHNYVLRCFKEQYGKLSEIDEEIKKLTNRLDNEKLLYVDKLNIERKLEELKYQKDKITSQEKLKEYIDRISPIYDNWKKIRQNEGNCYKLGQEKTFNAEKFFLVSSFIQIASEYTPLNLTMKTTVNNDICPYCRNKYSLDEDNKIICYECGICEDTLHNNSFYNISRVNNTNSVGYTNRENFIRTLNNYQGRQDVVLPQELFTKVDEYCTEKRINKFTLTHDKTRQIFKQIGFSDYYDHINLFLNMYINKPLPDISKYEEEILHDYDMFFQKFNEIKNDSRDSSLNSQYLLYILLRRRKIKNKNDINEFKIPDTKSILLESENIARKVFAELGWEFEDTI